MRRINGYVVGRSSLKGVSGWNVKVQEKGHGLDGQKVRVANVADGTTLSPGLDIDFLIERSNDQLVAVDVAYRGVTERGAKIMRRTIVGASAVLLVVLAVLAGIFRPWEWQAVKDELLSVKLESAISRLEGMAFAQMVGDDQVREVVKWGGSVYMGKVTVFDKYLCPVFGSPYYDEVKQSNDTRCFNALYASGGDGTNENYWYDKNNIPRSLAPRVAYFRQTMMEKAREFLRDPDRLWGFYQAKKQIIVATFHSANPERQQDMRDGLLEARAAFAHLYDPEVQALVQKYLAAEASWLKHHGEKDGLGDQRWQEYRAAEDELYWFAIYRLGSHRYSVLFAQRRHQDAGDQGPELVATCLRVIDDLIADSKH